MLIIRCMYKISMLSWTSHKSQWEHVKVLMKQVELLNFCQLVYGLIRSGLPVHRHCSYVHNILKIISVGKSYSHQEMPYFNREFPVLGGGNSGERLPPHMEGKDPPHAQHGQRPMTRNMRKWECLHILLCTKKILAVFLRNDCQFKLTQ